jgi:hypothetical protein
MPLAPTDAGVRDTGTARDGGRPDAGGPAQGDAGPAIDGRVPEACDNGADGMAFARTYGPMMDQTLGDVLEPCIMRCLGGDRVACFDDCALKQTGGALTPSCRLCVAEFMACGVEHCATECFPTMSVMCGRCLCEGDATMPDGSCELGFRACGGVPSPFEYDEVGFMCP